MAAAWAALAAWLAFGAIAFTGPSPDLPGDGARLGILPLDLPHVAVAALVGLAVLAIGWRHGRGVLTAVAVSPLALVFLPWLPFTVPAAFLVWSGALASVVWVGVAIALARVAVRPWHLTLFAWTRWPALAPGTLAFAVFALAAWFASPSLPGGDEPHYLVITQSLLSDGDLRIENNHRRGDYRQYFAGDLQPHVIRPGRNGEMYSIHAPGLPAIVLPAFAIAGYHGVVLFLILASASACALAWWLAWRVTGNQSAAWFGWAAVTMAAPFLLESYTVFPDGPGAVLVLTGFWAMLRAGAPTAEGVHRVEGAAPFHWLLHGAALALLPWMHTRFAVLAATLGGLILLRLARTRNPFTNAAAFLAVPALSAVAWLGFFRVIYGTLDPTAPYGGDVGSAFAYLPNGFGGLLFDQGFGLLATAPVLAVAVFGFSTTRRLGVEWLVVAMPYLVAVGTYAMWWGGSSGPARFLVPLVLPLAVPAACAWASVRSRGLKVVMLSALVVTAWLSAVMAGAADGGLGYHSRNVLGLTAAPYLEWASPVVNLPAAFPAFVPQPVQPDPGGMVSRRLGARAGFLATVVWILCLGGAACLVVLIGGRVRSGESLIASAVALFGCAAMVAMTVVWTRQAADPLTMPAGQMNALRQLASGPSAAFDLTSWRRVRDAEASIQIDVPIQGGVRGGGPSGSGPRGLNRPLGSLPRMPAGSYLVTVRRRPGAADGLLMVGVGNDQFAILMRPLADFDAGVRLDLPAGARTLTMRGDDAAREALQAIRVRSLDLADAPPLGGGIARRAVRYDAGVAFFLDDRSFPEPAGFWVGGARATSVVLAPDSRSGSLTLALRNAPVDNTVTVDFGGRREAMVLKPGEERLIEVPVDAATGTAAVTIRSAARFRPSEADPSSRDSRLLGVYVRTLAF